MITNEDDPPINVEDRNAALVVQRWQPSTRACCTLWTTNVVWAEKPWFPAEWDLLLLSHVVSPAQQRWHHRSQSLKSCLKQTKHLAEGLWNIQKDNQRWESIKLHWILVQRFPFTPIHHPSLSTFRQEHSPTWESLTVLKSQTQSKPVAVF